MKFDKRGQITIFVIVAIVIVAAVVLFFVLRSTSDSEDNLPPEVSSLKLSFENCLKSKAEDLISFSSLQGGYTSLPPSYLEYSFPGFDNYSILIPYYLDFGNSIIPSVDRIGEELSFAVNSILPECVESLDSDYFVSADYDSSEVSSSFDSNRIKFNVYLLMNFRFEDSSISASRFSFEVDSNFIRLYGVAKELTSSQEEFGNYMCVSCIPRISSENGVLTETTEVGGDNSYIVIYTLQDIEDDAVVFNFAHKFEVAESE